jgi:hypothetical protein
VANKNPDVRAGKFKQFHGQSQKADAEEVQMHIN